MSPLAAPSPSPVIDVLPPAPTTPIDNVPPETPPTRISAYYSLVFPNITFYLQTLTVTIGRRCIPPPSAPANTVDIISQSHSPVDVDLGPLKSVSRLHARIEYEEEEERFVLVVIGRNGAWVDGVWSGAGSRVPLCERSQIQIASRTFHFVLPPPPAPEDSPSPSSISSVQRARSPSVDITSISPPSSLPSHSPSPRTAPALPQLKPPRSSELQLPNANSIPRTKLASTSASASTSISNPLPTSIAPASKKRKKQFNPPPKPDVMPPKPQLTYAQLCYRAIKAMGGKATLQDICGWMMDNFDWYRYNEGAGWENSVRHNLSSGRAFKKMERSTGEHGKGFFWSVDEQYEHTFEEQDARAQAQAQSITSSSLPSAGSKDGSAKGSRKKEKEIPLDPPLKRSVKSGIGPLPPPLTSTPLVFPSKSASGSKSSAPPSAQPVGGLGRAQALAGPFTTVPRVIAATAVPGPSQITPSVGGSLASTTLASLPVAHPPTSSSSVTLLAGASPSPSSSVSVSPLATLPPSVCLPIIVGPVPSSHPSSSAPDPPPIVLHNNTLVLSPVIFSSLTSEQLKALEEMGAQKALEVLQGHIVRYLKERMGKKKRKKAIGSTEKGTTKSGKGDARERSSPFTTSPLAPRTTQTTPTPPHPLSQPPAGSSNLSDFCTTSVKSIVPNTVEVQGGVPSVVDSRPPVPVPIMVGERSETPIIVVDEDAKEERVVKRRKLGNDGESYTQMKQGADTTQVLQIVDEDIEIDVC